MKTKEIRDKFLTFFESKEHALIKSDSLIPANDPTLLFSGAGMNQFKDYFVGLKKDMTRAASSQKCLRTGDLDNVGVTAYHHSFFEMLGNFSFADYFKQEAIEWAWEFLTIEVGLSKDKLRVSVHTTDDEAYGIWKETVGINSDWIYRYGDKDNFWPANAPTDGPNGPCGPCSEIFYDQGKEMCPDPGCECEPSSDCDRFAEIWNLVFTQFDRVGVNELEPLASKNIDTGMGLERLACVLQEKKTNFQIDVFENLIQFLLEKTNKDALNDPAMKSAIYRITDHVRAATFCIADGAYPSNEGRGYVIRKLIRRAVWQGKLLGLTQPFINEMVKRVVETYGADYPELVENSGHIENVIKSEEERFFETLEDGLERLQSILSDLKKKGETVLSGEDVFKLYDTYGFPDELTDSIAKEEGITLDREGFKTRLEKQRSQAREASKISDAIFNHSEVDAEVQTLTATQFLGYEVDSAEGCEVLGIISEGALVKVASASEAMVGIILNQTPFYAEGGGQVGDSGRIESEGVLIEIEDTQKKGEAFCHLGKIKKGSLATGDLIEASVSSDRSLTMRNHTATHLLHAALREILGEHVRQMGSLVNSEKLRFDFTFERGLKKDELAAIENRVNEIVGAKIEVSREEKTFEEAKQDGALAFFGDKYGDRVRVVGIGDFSVEFCGGTHISNTNEIELFKIIKESSVASGTRRIEARTSTGAKEHLQDLKVTDSKKIAKEEKKKAAKQNKDKFLQEILNGSAIEDILNEPEEIATLPGVKVFQKVFSNLERDALLKVHDHIKAKVEGPYLQILVGENSDEGKLAVIVALSEDLVSAGKSAGSIAKKLAEKLGGKGGGKSNLAFAGGNKIDELSEVLSHVDELIG